MELTNVIDLALKWAVPIICTTVLGWVLLQIKKVKSIGRGLQALLRDRIYQAHQKYTDLGYYPVYARYVVDDMYKQYHELGGNGTITHLVEELQKLPTEKVGTDGKIQV